MANEIKFVVLGDVKDLEKKMSGAKKAFDTLAVSSGLALAGMTAAAYKFIDAATEQEAAINSLNQALKNQGSYSDDSSRKLIAYANALSKVSLFEDDQIVRAQAAMVAFGLEGKELQALTKVTLDFAQAKGMDLVSASELVAKSVGSSTNALARYGIEMDGVTSTSDRARVAIDGLNKLADRVDRLNNGMGEN